MIQPNAFWRSFQLPLTVRMNVNSDQACTGHGRLAECSVCFCGASEQACILASLELLNAPACESTVFVACDQMDLFCFREAAALPQWT